MSDAFDHSMVQVKEEINPEPWGGLQEIDSPPLGVEECNMPQQGAAVSVVKIEVEIDIEGYHLLQQPQVFSANEENPTTSQSTPTVGASSIKLEKSILTSRLLSATAHVQSEAEKIPYTCNVCSKSFLSDDKLKRHVRRNHRDGLRMPTEDTFKCPHCDYASPQRHTLNIHLRQHTGDKQFKCNQCEYRCYQKGNLEVHLRSHKGERPFKCNQCEYRFTDKSNLNRHLITHTGDKPLKCDQCEFRCIANSNLRDHLRTHTGEKPFKCNQCELRFSRRENLKSHYRKHTGAKPFKCDQCEYTCRRSDHLKRHLITHTGEKPFGCDQCEYRCGLKSHLQRHLKIHTRMGRNNVIDKETNK